MNTNKEKENDKFDRKVILISLFILFPLLTIAILLLPSVDIAFGLWLGFSLIVLGCLSFKHSIMPGDYFIYHWRGKTARFWAILNILLGIVIISGVLYFNYFANK
ncbi:hypothetical protein CO168_01065 [Candidatus Shapirobacteria bacterium CG_4_9_14_3_um_filter_36_12]|uniref:Uncharacterized protein n=4 Tax=Candidatus Shapironibacteriota TaxID=1752721 RepID=A0A1J5HR84_9BACT|nr:MAG: hypothetical protein AUK05_00940 [Candidatus Shapirobacteria bacterium CG2_30_35_20]PIV06596.1 MAG: hypothetical protein COS53_04060 [Candidatus Shapirobacteria bacterium CG03_land_8_20_14_0_80_35_14]PIX67911.1 MAG: hypothetical protein COZ41_02515 [Candidatus Shapirobacteria bacterium CG_4_10_14_3_um_filter_35_13]PJA51208.1 MAG: hypothetical protein CO168_01065 [Candidatus Shapirobacteria bacterium CG_4_9_14_3_um_filter_36_12]